MNKLNGLINNNSFENQVLYLLDKPNKDFGFFYQDKTVYFGRKSIPGTDTESIDTSYLDLNMNVYIQSVTLNSSFDSGYYDLLAFKGNIDDETYFDIFYNICNAYCYDSKGISFYDFFKSLTDIFKQDRGEVYKKLIGLIGELIVIKKFYKEMKLNISNNWHLTGTNSKFDFSFKNSNLEIKTTIKSELAFEIRHSQIFNNQNNYIGVCSLIETGEGESLQSLKDFFNSIDEFSNNVNFQISLNNEYMKVTEKKDREKSFVLDDFKIYSIRNMETITNVPSCISSISYKYDFSNIVESSINELFEDER